jgi:hypothetical protein
VCQTACPEGESTVDKRSWKSVLYYLPHLRDSFGLDRAIDITADKVRAYQSQRIDAGASNATVDREVATLGRMLSLAIGAGTFMNCQYLFCCGFLVEPIGIEPTTS